MRKMIALIAALSLSTALAAPTGVVATDGGTNTSDVVITTTVLNSCILTTENIDLSDYTATADGADTPSDSATVTVQCNDGASYTLSRTGGSSFDLDHDVLPGETLTVSLSDTLPSGTETITDAADAPTYTRSYTITADVDAGQFDAAAGDYSGTVTVTIDLVDGSPE
ncbi:spore coat protein U domain-containing protein [Deinococcus roseus]|uniref:Spore coat protein U domain-containing protein n=1 Tax=Deinococcus roseus TaxID=392414 RepID=A0ABQ2DF81_9DEIO|nr:spore coat protein U domain-containing protein [Deinococcus roseus]GGJ53762.1 hypothetical protein GCM10008938_44740 [Deinococcus roseus]